MSYIEERDRFIKRLEALGIPVSPNDSLPRLIEKYIGFGPSKGTDTGNDGGVSSGGVTAHGLLTGLANDDHTHYLTQSRADVRYDTKAQVDAKVDAVPDPITSHNLLNGLTADDHTQYLNTVRGDARYYTEAEIDAMFAAAPAGSGTTDHGLLTGLIDDDHAQYHNNTRGDARYYTKTQSDASLATKSGTAHSHTATDITNSTAVGRAVLGAADAPAARSSIGAGTSNLALGTTAGTAKAGDYAPPAASSTVSGVIELASNAETDTGEDGVRAVSPAALKNRLTGIQAHVDEASDFNVVCINGVWSVRNGITGVYSTLTTRQHEYRRYIWTQTSATDPDIDSVIGRNGDIIEEFQV